jgi:hypothetical protein
VTERTPVHLVGFVSAAIAATLLAGCGSSTTPPASSGGGGSQTSSGGSGSGGSGSSGSSSGTSVNDGIGHPVNVCSLLPAATAASVSGEPITVAQEQDTASYKIWTCNYTSADGTSGFVINVLADEAAVGYAADVQAAQTVGSKLTQISGLGDKAFSGPLGVEALFGNYSITVANLNSDTASATLIRDLQTKI